MTHNPVIACDFEFLTHQNQILFKIEASNAPAATAARYPSADGATHADQGLDETQRSSDGIAEKLRRNRKKKKEILNAPVAIHQINGVISPPP
jgi:hypothetical protein